MPTLNAHGAPFRRRANIGCRTSCAVGYKFCGSELISASAPASTGDFARIWRAASGRAMASSGPAGAPYAPRLHQLALSIEKGAPRVGAFDAVADPVREAMFRYLARVVRGLGDPVAERGPKLGHGDVVPPQPPQERSERHVGKRLLSLRAREQEVGMQAADLFKQRDSGSGERNMMLPLRLHPLGRHHPQARLDVDLSPALPARAAVRITNRSALAAMASMAARNEKKAGTSRMVIRLPGVPVAPLRDACRCSLLRSGIDQPSATLESGLPPERHGCDPIQRAEIASEFRSMAATYVDERRSTADDPYQARG